VDQDPVDGDRGDHAGQGRENEPERRGARRRPDRQQGGEDDGRDFGGAADREARIVDALHGEVGVAVQAHLARQLERMRAGQRGGQRHPA
jgi:hypothetical protein